MRLAAAIDLIAARPIISLGRLSSQRSPRLSDNFLKLLRLGFGPEAFEVVKRTLFRQKHVNDNVAVVHQHPTQTGQPLDVMGTAAGCFEPFLDPLGNGLDVRPVARGANDKVVTDDGERPQVEQNDIKSFLVPSRGGYQLAAF